MRKLSRREFLKSLTAGLGAMMLEQTLLACSQPQNLSPTAEMRSNPPATQSPVLTDTPGDTSTPVGQKTAESTPETTASTSYPHAVIAHGENIEEMVRRTLKALGGIERFVPEGSRVIVKPNICVAYHTYEYAATTNPWVVGAVVKLCLEARAASVTVMDSPFGGTAEEAYVRSGIGEQVELAGGKMAVMPGFKYVNTDVPRGLDLKKCKVFDDVLKADVLIDLPIAKHHSLARLTLGMKNLMGVIQDRAAMHRNLGQRLADLLSCVPPTLTIVDAIRVLKNHGPSGGNLDDVQKLDTLIASPDTVTADSLGTRLFGLNPPDLDYIRAATNMGLGRSDLEYLKIEEITVEA